MIKKAVCTRCRAIRLCLTGFLIVMSAVAGYHWGTIIETGSSADTLDYSIGGLSLILLVLVIFFAMDAVSARIEDQALLDADELQRLSRLAKSGEANAEKMELALAELAQDNAHLREMLQARDRHEARAPQHR